jgi:DNA repair protein RecN (Recombination protein N)
VWFFQSNYWHLRWLGELLIDMHGQNEHQLLLRNNQQRDLLDAYAQSPEL